MKLSRNLSRVGGRARTGTGRYSVAALAALLLATGACSKTNERPDSTGGTPPPSAQSNGAASPAAASPAAPSPAAPSASAAGGATGVSSREVVLFAGTSLTAGLGLEPDSAYPMLIQRKIDSAGLPFSVVNAGVSGETSSGFVDRLDWLLRGNFSVMVIETGANDGLRGLPPAELRANLEAALDKIKAKRPDARIVLVQMEALPNLGAKYARDFHAVYPAVAKEKGVDLLPFLLANVAGRRSLNQGDGVHPNHVGEHIVADNVWRGLEPILKALVSNRSPAAAAR